MNMRMLDNKMRLGLKLNDINVAHQSHDSFRSSDYFTTLSTIISLSLQPGPT